MTLHLDDARWRAAVDADLQQQATPEQAELLADHAPRGAEHRAEAEFLEALARPPEGLDEDPDWLTRAVDSHVQSAGSTRRYATLGTTRRWPLMVASAAALVLVAVSAAWILKPSQPARELQTAQLSVPTIDRPTPAPEPWQLASGSASLTAPTPTLPLDHPLTVESELCVTQSGHTICAEAGSHVTARSTGALALHRGTATVRTETSEDVRVELDEVVVHTGSHSVAVIERRTAGWSVTVETGSVTVTELGSTRRLQAGESLQREHRDSGATKAAPRKPSQPTAKASTLLARARGQRRDGDTRAAMQTYGALIRQHPRSPAAQTARMSLAQLHLDGGKAKDALRLFRAYGKRGGPLAEEAAFGEVRALRALGRGRDAKRAADAFLQRYPDSPYGAKLKP